MLNEALQHDEGPVPLARPTVVEFCEDKRPARVACTCTFPVHVPTPVSLPVPVTVSAPIRGIEAQTEIANLRGHEVEEVLRSAGNELVCNMHHSFDNESLCVLSGYLCTGICWYPTRTDAA